jgi:hypothetical protein
VEGIEGLHAKVNAPMYLLELLLSRNEISFSQKAALYAAFCFGDLFDTTFFNSLDILKLVKPLKINTFKRHTKAVLSYK